LHEHTIKGKANIPQVLAFDELHDLLMVGVNSIEKEQSRIDIFSLFDDSKGLVGLNLVK
jgi:hypothetical protein